MSFTVLNVGQNYHIRGGSDQYLLSLSKLLEQYSHLVIPFATASPKNHETQWSKYFPERVNFDSPNPKDILNYLYSQKAALAMTRLLKETRVDIAHLHIYYGQLTSSILSPLIQASVPIIQTLHEYKIVCPTYTLLAHDQICQTCDGHAFWKATIKKCNRGSLARSFLSTIESYISKILGSVHKIDHFIAVSHFQREKVVELGIPANKVTTVHNFIDASNIKVNTDIGEYFLYFGRLEKYKGIFTLVEAASEIKDIPLLMVGDHDNCLELKALIRQKDLKHIHLLGFKQKDELQKLIRNSICTVAPSEWYETFGLTLIESFAHGRPVIASRMGGMTEIVTHGVDGYLFSPGNVDQLRDYMLWMAAHRYEAVEMGLAGRRKVETQFHPAIHYEQIMNVYRQVL